MNYFLHGSESYLLKKKLEFLILDSVIEKDEFNTIFYDGSSNKFSIYQFIDDANTIPFLTDKKVVVVTNPSFLTTSQLNDAEFELLSNYLNTSNEGCDVIFCVDGEKMDSRKKTYKLLQKTCRTFEFKQLSLNEFESFVLDDIKEHHLNISRQNQRVLLNRLSNNILRWKNELDKLVLVEGELTEDLIEKLVIKPLEDDVFTLVNDVIDKKVARAYQTYKDLLVSNHDPIYLVALIAGQLRLMYQCRVLANYGKSESEITSELAVHPFRVKKALEATRRKNTDELLQLLAQLASIDQDIKSGKADKYISFERFLLEGVK